MSEPKIPRMSSVRPALPPTAEGITNGVVECRIHDLDAIRLRVRNLALLHPESNWGLVEYERAYLLERLDAATAERDTLREALRQILLTCDEVRDENTPEFLEWLDLRVAQAREVLR